MGVRSEIKKNLRIMGFIMLLLVSVSVLSSCSLIPSSLVSRQQEDPMPRTEDILVPVVRGSIRSSLSFVGNLRYNQSAALTWKTDGVIDKVYVKAGDKVRKGDILAELAPYSLSSNVLLAEKDMIEQQEKLEDVKGSESARMQAYVTLNQKESDLIQAKLAQEVLYYPRATREEMEIAWDKYALAHLNFNYAKQDYDFIVSMNIPWEGSEPESWRYGRRISGGDARSGRERKFEDYLNAYNELVSSYEKYVWTAGRPTDTEYAVAQGNVAVAQMEYDKALEDYLSYNVMPRAKDVQAVELSLNSAETVYQLRYITAPFDGVVTSVDAVESYYVKKDDEALRVDDLSSIYVPLNIPELDISALSYDNEVKIVIDAVKGRTYSGHLFSIAEASTLSDNTTAFSAMVKIDDPDENLKAGLTAEVSLDVHEKNNVLLIPDTAISYEGGSPYVTAAAGDERKVLKITTGLFSNGITEVTSGNLHEGDLLVMTSISAEVLSALGLDPSVYISAADQPYPVFSGTVPAVRENSERVRQTPEPTAAEVQPDPDEPENKPDPDGGAPGDMDRPRPEDGEPGNMDRPRPEGGAPGRRNPQGPDQTPDFAPRRTPAAAPGGSGDKG